LRFVIEPALINFIIFICTGRREKCNYSGWIFLTSLLICFPSISPVDKLTQRMNVACNSDSHILVLKLYYAWLLVLVRMVASFHRETALVLMARIDASPWLPALDRLMSWAHARDSRYVTICNVHVVVTASRDLAYCNVINASDMATPDGAPVAWMLRRQGFIGQTRISGPELMWALCERAAAEHIPVYCYGSTEATLDLLRQRLLATSPDLQLVVESPPFRVLTAEEDDAAVARINASGAGFVFVGLGCPKQEMWMAAHRGRVNAVMIGVGAAFDFHAGTVTRAPEWMRNYGLEWLHRLASEPRRLWRRYLVTNILFIVGAARQLLFRKD
jgi:N-acetylglucosaminyldiphosphoundecaprenol N-acetyl-beta-D-mannosaminyltransferase